MTDPREAGIWAAMEAYADHPDAECVHPQAMHAAVAAYEAAQWQPISEAPKGTRLLLWVPPYGPSTGHYDEHWHYHSVLNTQAEPTHFRYITPPETPHER